MDESSLTAISLFARLPEEQREELASVCSELDVEPGTVLVQEGDFGYAVFGVVDGSADVVKDGETIRTLQPGDVFGEVAVLSGGRRTASVIARSSMRLVTVLNRDVWRLEREVPSVAASLRRTISECLAREA